MGRISSGVGLVSGINSKDIIDQLIALESRPKDLVQAKLDGVNQQKLAVIDISAAVNLQDVIKKINTTLDVQVHAKLDGDKIVLEDVSGKTTSNLIVQDLADGSAAADLGIVANLAGNTITGTDINSLGRDTALAQLN